MAMLAIETNYFGTQLGKKPRGMFWRNSRGRPINAPAAFVYPCQPIVARLQLGAEFVQATNSYRYV
jgi:hypothetical protein